MTRCLLACALLALGCGDSASATSSPDARPRKRDAALTDVDGPPGPIAWPLAIESDGTIANVVQFEDLGPEIHGPGFLSTRFWDVLDGVHVRVAAFLVPYVGLHDRRFVGFQGCRPSEVSPCTSQFLGDTPIPATCCNFVMQGPRVLSIGTVSPGAWSDAATLQDAGAGDAPRADASTHDGPTRDAATRDAATRDGGLRDAAP